ncbi:NAD(P)H-dependent oxidoreductase [Paenibacillus sp. P96]|uniref:NAD(P)H-dependent oxidoreductase n=1 Tax=Paenibacillus zeirhizosphaerae TaxID=2987519 RepID=A0ABT9FU74_9BACL|nr:NAD(P)H-dependent oxidoreductase [Paenibacillus sp. P96]MDP4098288.1 NAD(P)H-dependent oxidoreductase [Paenibacillus sp. P96]
MAAFEFRHATKEFDPTKKISAEDFNVILETARLSPSSVGLEPWKFVVVQNPDLREKLRTVSWGAQGQMPTASHVVLILANDQYGISVMAAFGYRVKTPRPKTRRAVADVIQWVE